MHRLNDYYEETIAGHYLAALMHDDETGLSDDESADLAAFMRQYDRLPDMTVEIVDDEPSFCVDAVSDLHADCYTVRFHFTNHLITPQQQPLDLN